MRLPTRVSPLRSARLGEPLRHSHGYQDLPANGSVDSRPSATLQAIAKRRPRVASGCQGAPPRPPPLKPSGYVFLCNSATERECSEFGLLGSPPKELDKMKEHIDPSTRLFLHNFETKKLLGPFYADGLPARNIVPHAFGARFGAQIRIKPAASQAFEILLDAQLKAGPLSATEANYLFEMLEQQGSAWAGAILEQSTARRWPRPQGGMLPAAATSAAGLKRGRDDSVQTLEAVAKRRDEADTICWNFARGGCVKGEACRYLHVAHSKGGWSFAVKTEASTNWRPGYLFYCNHTTEQECENLAIFGSPDRELDQMQKIITPGAEVFLFNIDTLQLLGSFHALAAPGRNLVPGAFGGKFPAQVMVAPSDIPILRAQLDRRIPAGAKTAKEVEHFKLLFRNSVVEEQQDGQYNSKRRKMEPIEHGSKRVPRPLVKEELARVDTISGVAKPLVKYEKSNDNGPVGELAFEAAADEELIEEPIGTTSSTDVCWDFVTGNCPRGERCRYPHEDATATGYMFRCSNATATQCQSLRLLGSPQRELKLMKHCIRRFDTELLLLNYETMKLTGPFVAIEEAGADIVPGAFGGKFTAQVRVVPLDFPLQEAQLNVKIPAGPLLPAALAGFKQTLRTLGRDAQEDVQKAWSGVDE